MAAENRSLSGHRSTPSTSFIPVPVMPRPAQTSLPSSLSLPQLALQSQQRNNTNNNNTFAPNGSATPASPPTPNIPSTPSSAKSTFRSFRSLLPFGAAKPQTPNTSTNITPKPRTLSLGRSPLAQERKPVDRKVTEPLRQQPSGEFSPVVLIEASASKVKDSDYLLPTINQEPLSTRASPLSSPLSLRSANDLPPPSSPGQLLGDLSTIIESETSAISILKHIPAIDDSIDEGAGQEQEQEDQREFLSPRSRGLSARTPESVDTSAFDLSTSRVAEEVMDAMSEGDRKGDWLTGVVVDDEPKVVKAKATGDRIHDVSFNLSALDPELATLLSPNKMTSPAALFAMKSIPSPTRNNESTEVVPSSSGLPPPSPSTSDTWSSARPSRDYGSQQPSPLQSRTSLAASTSSRSPSGVPRFVHPWRSEKTTPRPEMIDLSPSDLRQSLTASRRRPPPSPNSVDEHGFLKRNNTGESYRQSSSRLGAPARTSTLHYPPSSRPPLRHLTSTGPWDAESVSPSSRASSSLGTSISRRQHAPRPSIESEDRISFDHDRTSPYHHNRSRSMSESRASPGPGFAGYRSASVTVRQQTPGPRTTRLFRAAGLIANEDDRYGAATDFRQTAPSRSGYSEVSRSSSSWGRNRTGTVSESASVRGMTPFSGSSSTAPTTVSISSVHNNRDRDDEVGLLREKHQMETDALLNALYDSQHVNKILREENAGLRDRVQELEDRNLDLLDQLRRPPLPAPVTVHRYPSHDRIPRNGSVEVLYQRNRPPRLQPMFPPSDAVEKHTLYRSASSGLRERELRDNNKSLDPNSFLDGSVGRRSNRKNRLSVSSSVFQAPPSTMSMLNDDEDDDEILPQDSAAFPTDSPPPSPTLVFGNVVQQQQQQTHNAGQASLGNISPTTANFSSLQDSPTSLRLLSDHEDHLGDMASLDLRAEYDMDGMDDI